MDMSDGLLAVSLGVTDTHSGKMGSYLDVVCFHPGNIAAGVA